MTHDREYGVNQFLFNSQTSQRIIKMDIDRVEENSAGGPVPRRTLVPIDDDHPFDLDGYISNYSGECHHN